MHSATLKVGDYSSLITQRSQIIAMAILTFMQHIYGLASLVDKPEIRVRKLLALSVASIIKSKPDLINLPCLSIYYQCGG